MNDSPLHWFYISKNWRLFRKNLIAERGCRCQRCGKLVLNSRELIAHHIIELTEENVHDPMIALNPDNTEIVCFDCHELEKRDESVTEFDENGFPYPPLK